jgi:hypothetical protein
MLNRFYVLAWVVLRREEASLFSPRDRVGQLSPSGENCLYLLAAQSAFCSGGRKSTAGDRDAPSLYLRQL